MVALLLWVCLSSAPTECRVALVARGFVADQQCQAYSPLMVRGWLDMHPELKLRDGTRPLCTSQAEYLLHRFGA